MDPVLDQRLRDIEKKLENMSGMLRSLRRAQRMASFMKLLYWAILVGLAIASFTFIKPYLEQIRGIYDSTQNMKSSYGDFLNFLN